DSSTQVVPVISPLPFNDHQAANTASSNDFSPRGKIAVTPVRTGPLPASSFPSPEISVVWPTVTPGTSVIALNGPGVPSKGTPRSRARGLAAFFSCGQEGIAIRTEAKSKAKNSRGLRMRGISRINKRVNEEEALPKE